jgi:Kef-type K+ transport system membrane component KefB
LFFLTSAAITDAIGIFSVFGAFLLGGILHDQTAFCRAVRNRMHDLVTVFFLPIFFTLTGLRTDVGSLPSGALNVAAAVILVASIAKFGGCTIAGKVSGLTWREACCVGTMMNTRGLMELVVLNTGYESALFPGRCFSSLY